MDLQIESRNVAMTPRWKREIQPRTLPPTASMAASSTLAALADIATSWGDKEESKRTGKTEVTLCRCTTINASIAGRNR